MLPERSSLMGSRQPTPDLTRGVFARLGSPRLYFAEFRCQSKIVTCPSDTHLHFMIGPRCRMLAPAHG